MIDEKALEAAWLADGKPISWERLKWIVYEARAISQNRKKDSEMDNIFEYRVNGGESLLTKNNVGKYSGPIYEEIKAQVIKELSDDHVPYLSFRIQPGSPEQILFQVGDNKIMGDGSVIIVRSSTKTSDIDIPISPETKESD